NAVTSDTQPNDNCCTVNQSVNLHILYSNVRSIKNKLSELHFVMSETGADITVASETWLNDTILDSMIAPDGFCVFRKDRCITKRYTTVKRGGGVCIIYRERSRVVFKRVDLPPRFQNIDVVAVDILLGNSGTRLIAVYYPPDQTSDLVTCQLLLSALMYVGNTHLSVCIIGDLNLLLWIGLITFLLIMMFILNFMAMLTI